MLCARDSVFGMEGPFSKKHVLKSKSSFSTFCLRQNLVLVFGKKNSKNQTSLSDFSFPKSKTTPEKFYEPDKFIKIVVHNSNGYRLQTLQ